MAKIRAQAFGQLIEMARWTNPGHAGGARLVLGMVAGIPQDKLEALLRNGSTDEIIEAAKNR